MKKILISLLVLACVAPTMAATTVDAVGGDKEITVTITVADDDVVRGVAIAVAQSAGDTGDLKLAEGADVSAPAFNTYIDWAVTNASGYDVGMGHAAAKIDAAGAIDDAADNRLPAAAFSVSAGYLDQTEQQGGLGAGVYTITIALTGTSATCFDVSLDTLRGGIVGDNLEVTDNTAQVCVAGGVIECIDPSHPDYTQWTAVGKPQSWCADSQCYGDADGVKEQVGKQFFSVSNNDLQILITGYAKAYSGDPVAQPWIAADFDRNQEQVGKQFFRVSNNDLQILITNYAKLTVGTDCNQ